MTTLHVSLFEGEHVLLTPPDLDLDAPVESGWTHDAEFLRRLSARPARPVSPAQIKKRHEAILKQPLDARQTFEFAIRLRQTQQLIGFARFTRVQWHHGTAEFGLGIGEAGQRNRGYGGDALRLALRYAFHELNLHRLTAIVPASNDGALRFFARAGFATEAVRRESISRDGQRWDLVYLGLLREDWANRGREAGSPETGRR
jgi:RimJ/RimL family protein N-acetyltransferase